MLPARFYCRRQSCRLLPPPPLLPYAPFGHSAAAPAPRYRAQYDGSGYHINAVKSQYIAALAIPGEGSSSGTASFQLVESKGGAFLPYIDPATKEPYEIEGLWATSGTGSLSVNARGAAVIAAMSVQATRPQDSALTRMGTYLRTAQAPNLLSGVNAIQV